MENIEVTVYCLVYNHGKFLRDALEGFVSQKTNFRYKVIVHDDASTDNSAEIIREYEEKYPDIIKAIYQTENQYSKGVKIVPAYIYPHVEGRYIAICEGDDFWTDENKLQKQYDALENNKECHFCFCSVRETNEEGIPTGRMYPETGILNNGRISSEEMIRVISELGHQFHTSSYFCRREFHKEFTENPEKYRVKSKIGDAQLLLFFAYKGDAYFIDETMSSYRKNSTNWSSRVNTIPEEKLNMIIELENIYKKFDEYTGGKYHKYAKKRIDIMRRGYVHCCLGNNWNKKVCGIKYWKYFDSKKELIYCILKAYTPKLLKLIGKED